MAARKDAIYYVARYEDAVKIGREAKRIGWTAGDGTLLDELDANDIRYITARTFGARRAAIIWLTQRINAGATFFGCGDIIEVIQVNSGSRCRHCTCEGAKNMRRWRVKVDAGGVGELCDEHHYDDCWADGYAEPRAAQ